MLKIKFSLLEKIVIAIILFACILGVTSIVRAETIVTKGSDEIGTWQGRMPARQLNGVTGLFPQLYTSDGKRELTLSPDYNGRVAVGTKTWSADVKSNMVYCAACHKTLQFGYYENAEHYLVPTRLGGINLQGYTTKQPFEEASIKETIELIQAQMLKQAKINREDWTYWDNPNHKANGNDTVGSKTPLKTADAISVTYEASWGDPNGWGVLICDENDINEFLLGKIRNIIPKGEHIAGGTSDLMQLVQKYAAFVTKQTFEDMLGSKVSVDSNSENADRSTGGFPQQSAGEISGEFGPKVMVMETEEFANDGYEVYAGQSIPNTAAAFIFSAAEDAYNGKRQDGSSYGTKYDIYDIQTAFWIYQANHGMGEDPISLGRGTPNGAELYRIAEQYEAELAGKEPAVTIDSSNARVVADRGAQKYYVGPFKVNYPYIKDACYLKALVLGSADNPLAVYDEEHSDLKIHVAGGKANMTEVIGSNGLMKEYPKSGADFFIEFDAATVAGLKSVPFHARVEYVENTSYIETARLRSKADLFQYFGYIYQPGTHDGEHEMFSGSVTFKVKNYNKTMVTDPDKCGNGTYTYLYNDDGSPKLDENDKHMRYENQTKHYANENPKKEVTMELYQPYIKMDDEYLRYEAQELAVETDAHRTYKIKDVKAPVVTPHTPPPSEDIDLTMELGGYVWVNEAGGKENTTTSGRGTPVPGMKVTLSNGAVTYTDSQGKYLFKDLDPMYKYSVTFEYNAQYYQPIGVSSGKKTWATAQWPNNSNAADNVSEREQFNMKFAKIGSEHGSYNGPKPGSTESYTKEELLAAGAINEFGLPTGSGTGLMAQYVRDCMLNAYTIDEYPIPDAFTIEDKVWAGSPYFIAKYRETFHTDPPDWLYPHAYYINLGLEQRPYSDLAVKKDLEKVVVEINGHTHTYKYEQRSEDEDWEIGIRLSDGYYDTTYTRQLYKSDYIYKASNYGPQPELYGKSKEDELEVYVTYKILVRNQSLNIKMRVDELVDYYDEDFEYVDERSYMANGGKVGASNSSIYGTNGKMSGCNNLYITGLKGKYLNPGETAKLFLTFKVKKDLIEGDEWIRLDYQGLNKDLSNLADLVAREAYSDGKKNTVEINGYSTIYVDGMSVPNIGDVSGRPAGIVDRDSHSGDAYRSGHLREDDTDQAPNLKLVLYKDDQSRIIKGTVFEDGRSMQEPSQGLTTIGDGNMGTAGDSTINGVTVQLVEITNGTETEFVWREFGSTQGYGSVQGPTIGTTEGGSGTGNAAGGAEETAVLNKFGLVGNAQVEGQNAGGYVFKSFMPGEFVIRFIYGDTVKTVLPQGLSVSGQEGKNAKSYNGQDYKSTLYQDGISQPAPYTWTGKSTWTAGSETPTQGSPITTVSGYDLTNNETVTPGGEQKGYLYGIEEAEENPNASDAKDIESRRIEVNSYSAYNVRNYLAEVLASHKLDFGESSNSRVELLEKLIANTNMRAETGMMVIELEKNSTETEYGSASQGTYNINHVNLGLEERPRAQLKINKHVENVKLTLADGSILFDAKDSAQNLLWVQHKEYETGYNNNLLREDLFKSIENIRNRHADNIGIVQLTMDEELMHGATIEITYGITITNVGEVDYYDSSTGTFHRGFYYKANAGLGGGATVVPTKPSRLVDYVANNLQFSENANKAYNWKTVQKSDIFTANPEDDLVNRHLYDLVDEYNTIIATDQIDTWLTPEIAGGNSSVTVPLVLTQMITSENDTDDLTYRNLVEIVETSNVVGRRMEYSIVGNQDPTIDPQEMDADLAEVVRILPPFGSTVDYYLILTVSLGAVAILIVGIIFIKKKVLTK